MKIRMKIEVLGAFHGVENGVRIGDEVDVKPDEEAVRYCALGYAEPVTKSAEKAVAREERAAEKAVAEAESEGVENASYENLDVPEHPVSSAALEPDAIVHDVTPDHPRKSGDTPLKPERPRASKTATVPTTRAKPGNR